ncbi:Protein kinase domain [Dillenia turbinata]|uniref:Protein kinase domain n=1 Tax=Dillenia turbinata TaxID=194707 RepID=A0AAN8VNT3_9MAGN
MNITTKSQFETLIPNSTLKDVVSNCNQSLENNSPCASCTLSLSSLQAQYLTGPSIGNVSDCTAYPSIYAAAFANSYGPTDLGTAYCLFQLDFYPKHKKRNVPKIVISVVVVCFVIGVLIMASGYWFFWTPRKRKRRNRIRLERIETGLDLQLESTTLVRYTFDDIKKATRNFSRENIIGRGGYGNVYKGVLPDGSEVAFKRFKNCSAARDANFTNEVEVIASVRHVNLVTLIGYCTATTPFEGHQRIIVCDLIKNGRALDVIEDGMPEMGPPELMEKFVLLAVLCSHPVLHARPPMDQIVKILETDLPVPLIPERPISIVADIEDIERSASSSGSGNLSTPAGYQTFTVQMDRHSNCT